MLGIDLPRLGNTHVRKRESGKGGYKFISGLFLTELAGLLLNQSLDTRCRKIIKKLD